MRSDDVLSKEPMCVRLRSCFFFPVCARVFVCVLLYVCKLAGEGMCVCVYVCIYVSCVFVCVCVLPPGVGGQHHSVFVFEGMFGVSLFMRLCMRGREACEVVVAVVYRGS